MALLGRRTLLGAGAIVVGGSWLLFRSERELEYRALTGLGPFRELVSGGSVSAASLAWIGLQQANPGETEILNGRVAEVRSDLCAALFRTSLSKDLVPMAYFSDFNCPNCKVLEGEIAQVLDEDPSGVALVRHELPLLGGASSTAARAVLAADRQGGYNALRERLLRAGLITDEPYVRAVSADLGMDPDLLIKDMASPEVTDLLLTSRALGRVFGFVGTPALVVGRTVIIGSVPSGTIKQVIADERRLPTLACSAG